MDNRHLTILGGLIREYIRTARPVGSVALARALNVELSPATVRAILHDLGEEGFTHQPHTSAGRLPTDRGYRYFLDHVGARGLNQAQQQSIAREFEELAAQYSDLARATSKLLARLAHAIAISGFLTSRQIQEAGLQEMMEQPEGENIEAVREVSRMVEAADQFLEDLAGNDQAAQVYIGEENPFFPAQHTSLVVRSVRTPDEEKVVFVVVGPKRMEYHRNVSIINALAAIVQNRPL